MKRIAMCVVASVLWLVAFALGRRFGVTLAALGGAAFIVVAAALTQRDVRALLQPRLRDLFWGVAVGGASLGATYALYPLLRAGVPGLADDVRAFYTLVPVSAVTVPVVLLIVVAEELLWRGALLASLKREHPIVAAVALASVLYASAQLGAGLPVLAAAALGLGAAWAAEAVFTDGLFAPLVSHALWTLTVFGVFPLER